MKNANKIVVLNIASTVILQGVTLLTTPIFTRVLGTEQYGIYSVFHSWVVILACVYGLGVNTAIGTGMYQFKGKFYEFRNCLLLYGTIVSAVMILLGMIFAKPIGTLMGYDVQLLLTLYIMALSTFVINFANSTFKYEKKAYLNFVMSTTLAVATVVVSLVLITKFDESEKYLGRIYGVAISYFIIALVMWGGMFFQHPTRLKKMYCRFGFEVGFPVVFHSLATNVLTQSDRVMMQWMNVSNSEIGIYSLYYTFVNVMATLLSALNTSWCPFYYDDLDAENWNVLKEKCKNYIEIYTVLAVGFLLLSREVSYILADSDYCKGINIIPILVMAVYFTFMYQFAVNFEFFYRKTKFIAGSTMATALVNIILNMIMIPLWGMYGAAVATTLSYGMLFVTHHFIATHMKEQKYHIKVKTFLPGVMAVLITMALFYLLADMWIIRWGIGIVVGGVELYRIIKRRSIF